MSKRRYMHGKRRRRSPIKDVDTTFADRIYTKERVDKSLEDTGHYTHKGGRGKKREIESYTGKPVGGGSGKIFLGGLEI